MIYHVRLSGVSHDDLQRAIDTFVRRLQDEIHSYQGRRRLAELLAKSIRDEFIARGIIWTGKLADSIYVDGNRIVVAAPHAWKFAEGYHRVATKRHGRWYAAGSDASVLTRWVREKGTAVAHRKKFNIRIPEDHGYAGDAYMESIDRHIESAIDMWVELTLNSLVR